MNTLLHSKQLKIPLLVIGAIAAVVLLAIATTVVLKMVTPVKKDSATHTEMSLAKIRDSAAIAENTGNTDQALVYYHQALANYVASGNKDGIADITAKITQLENWKIQEKATKEQALTDAKKRAIEAGNPPTIPGDPNAQ